MDWLILESEEQLDQILIDSANSPILLFKHSTRCSISTMAKTRLERNWNKVGNQIIPYYLDLLNFRSISNEIASRFAIEHQSPQVLLLQNGKVIHTASHEAISVDNLLDAFSYSEN